MSIGQWLRPRASEFRMQCIKQVEWMNESSQVSVPTSKSFVTFHSGDLPESQSCSFLFLPFGSLTRCNPITFSNKWNAFIPSTGNNLGSHIGSLFLRSPLLSLHLLPLLATPFTALRHYPPACLTSHPPAAFCDSDIWTLASCKMHQFLKNKELQGPRPCIGREKE